MEDGEYGVGDNTWKCGTTSAATATSLDLHLARGVSLRAQALLARHFSEKA